MPTSARSTIAKYNVQLRQLPDSLIPTPGDNILDNYISFEEDHVSDNDASSDDDSGDDNSDHP